MAHGWFVTGTDTGVGKTWVSQALIRAFVRTGQRVVGMKPVASGCARTPQGLRSADAEALIAAGNVAVDYRDVNPYAFEPATAPHLAANAVGTPIQIEVIRDYYQRLATGADTLIVEGIGGWQVPISTTATMADVVQALDLPVILVVGLRLGAINHALLTQEAISARGCRLVGWVANALQSESPVGYLETLQDRLPVPLLGLVPHDASPEMAADCLNLGVFTRSTS
ncbi:MAG TPA: dethiobiotin synthase [Gammaproteobacteria bacterium]|nr:dethiobiotin synthase [Gammaproteobacteria bacterium]